MLSGSDDDLLTDLLTWEGGVQHDNPSSAEPASSVSVATDGEGRGGPGDASQGDVAVSLEIPSDLLQKLLPHQIEGVQWLYRRHCKARAALLADEMGLGKTVQVCALLGQLYARKEIKSAVVVAPVTLLRMWETMLKEWGRLTAPGMVEIIHGGSKKKREERWRRLGFGGLACVIVTSYGMLRQDGSSAAAALQSCMLDYVVLDEAHSIKDTSSAVFQSAMQLSARHRIALTGTPLMNSFEDMWGLFQFLDGAVLSSISSSRSAFNAISRTILRGNERDASVKETKAAEKDLAALHKLVQPLMLRREKKDVAWAHGNEEEEGEVKGSGAAVKAPSVKTDTVVWLQLTSVQQAQYDSVLALKSTAAGRGPPALCHTVPDPDSADFFMENDVLGDGEEGGAAGGASPATAQSSPSDALGLLSLLRDTCQHPWLHLSEAAFYEAVRSPLTMPCPELGDIWSSAKMAAALELVRRECGEGNNNKMVVFSRSKKLLLLFSVILKRETSFGVIRIDGDTKPEQRHALVRQFNQDEEGGAMVCLLSMNVGGLGLTFDAASCVILLDTSWNPALDNQAIDRVHRIGQSKHVRVYRLVTCGTVEEKTYRNQIFKLTAATQFTRRGGGATAPVVSRHFTRLQLRDMFARGDFEQSETAMQLRHILGDEDCCHPQGLDEGESFYEEMLTLPHVVDVSRNEQDYLFSACKEGTTPLDEMDISSHSGRRGPQFKRLRYEEGDARPIIKKHRQGYMSTTVSAADLPHTRQKEVDESPVDHKILPTCTSPPPHHVGVVPTPGVDIVGMDMIVVGEDEEDMSSPTTTTTSVAATRVCGVRVVRETGLTPLPCNTGVELEREEE